MSYQKRDISHVEYHKRQHILEPMFFLFVDNASSTLLMINKDIKETEKTYDRIKNLKMSKTY